MKINKIIFCSILLLSGCSSINQANPAGNTNTSQNITQGWKKFEVSNTKNKFTFYIPPDFNEEMVQGEDSIVKSYKNSTTSISLDYGSYSDPLDSYKTMPEYQETNTTISGKSAKIISSKKDDKYISAVNFPEISTGLKLTIYIESSDANIKDTGKKIFESISFQ